MWLVTFLLLLDSLHKGETLAGGRVEEAACGGARGWRPGGVPGWLQVSRGPAPVPGPGWGTAGTGQAPRERPGESPSWTARPATRAYRFGASGCRVMEHEPLISLSGRSSAPGPILQPLARLLRLVALGPRGALPVEGSSGHECVHLGVLA